MLYEVQTATNKNLCLTCLVPQSGKKNKNKNPDANISACKHFAFFVSWNSDPKFSACASTSLFYFHETQAGPNVFSLCAHFTA